MNKRNITLMTAVSSGLRKLGAGGALVLALTMAAQAQPGGFREGPHGGPGGGGMGMDFNPRMLRELHLSADQEKKLKDGKLAVQKQKIQLHSDKSVLELDLKNILSTYPVNKAEALKLADKIADVDKKLMTLRVESMVALLSGLTAEQHAKLLDIQEEWHEKRKAWMDEMRKDRKDGRDAKEGKDGGKDGGRGGHDPSNHD
ncbi:MAG: periplasmic heavy metal sensor [Fibrobacteria bacterium]